MKRQKRLGCYVKQIIKVVECSEAEATVVEEIMRCDIFHSTLDWQTAEEIEAGARAAFAALKKMRKFGVLPEPYLQILNA